MFLVIFAAASGAVLALALRGGSLRTPEDLRAAPALALGLLGLIAAEWVPVPGRPGIYIVASALVVAALIQNIRFSGAFITALGIFLTGFVVLINGYLPLRVDAAEAASIDPSGLRQFETPDTTLGILGDVVPFPVGPFVVSFGDLIAAAGAFILARGLVEEDEDDDGLDADEFLAEFLGTDFNASPGANQELDLRQRRPQPRPTTIDLTQPSSPPPPVGPRVDSDWL